jgi:glycosyltransferase involved in cell wall biosynthesis
MSNQPLVSVIVPAYNHAKFIGETIDSIMNQAYLNIMFLPSGGKVLEFVPKKRRYK